jgi:hypothetical protein
MSLIPYAVHILGGLEKLAPENTSITARLVLVADQAAQYLQLYHPHLQECRGQARKAHRPVAAHIAQLTSIISKILTETYLTRSTSPTPRRAL